MARPVTPKPPPDRWARLGPIALVLGFVAIFALLAFMIDAWII